MKEIDREISDDDLQAYVDDRLDAAHLPQIDAYLTAHPDVATRVASYRQQRQDLRQAFAEAVPMDTLTNQAFLQFAQAYQLRNRQRRALAAVATIAVLIGTASGWLLHGATHPIVENAGIVALADEASTAHLVYASDGKRPVEIDATHAADLDHWLSTRLARPVAALDLSPAGYRLMGGRLVATDHGPAALYIYDDDKGTRVSLLIRPMAKKDMEAPPQVIHANGVDGCAWAKAGMGFSLVGTNGDALEKTADEILKKTGGI